MIRFVDLSDAYWTDSEFGFQLCAWLCTTTDRFLETLDGEHTFQESDIDEYPVKDVRERMRALTPPGFWEKSRSERAGRVTQQLLEQTHHLVDVSMASEKALQKALQDTVASLERENRALREHAEAVARKLAEREKP